MVPPAFLGGGGHSTASPVAAVVFFGLALVLAVLRSRARGGGRGPFGRGRYGGGPAGGENGQWGHRPSSDDTPVQWDIRKPSTEGTDQAGEAPDSVPRSSSGHAPYHAGEGPSDVQNPPSDL